MSLKQSFSHLLNFKMKLYFTYEEGFGELKNTFLCHIGIYVFMEWDFLRVPPNSNLQTSTGRAFNKVYMEGLHHQDSMFE